MKTHTCGPRRLGTLISSHTHSTTKNVCSQILRLLKQETNQMFGGKQAFKATSSLELRE